MEVLISSLITGAVIGMALKAFGEIKRVADLSTSRSIAQSEATNGVLKASEFLRRAQIYFYTGRPMKVSVFPLGTPDADIRKPWSGQALRDGVPDTFAALNGGARVLNGNAPTAGQTLGSFRFGEDSSEATTGGTYLAPCSAGARLVSNQTLIPLTANGEPNEVAEVDNVFPSPLAYMAVATFSAKDTIDTSTNMYQNIPIGWTFYVFYLAPMQLQASDALVPVTGSSLAASRDLGSTNGVTWTRNALPLELHMLSIDHVPAATTMNAWVPDPTAATYRSDIGRNADAISLLPVPFDFDNGKANYDPIPTDENPASVNALKPATTPYPGSLGLESDGNGIRVNNGGAHGNWGNLGNDPPTKAALEAKIGGNSPITSDTVIAKYIDPDSVNGTFIRFVNSSSIPTTCYGKLPAGKKMVRRLMNAYEPEELLDKPNAPVPTRLVLSISTRFRNSRQVPFQFASEVRELNIEGVSTYQNTALNRTSR